MSHLSNRRLRLITYSLAVVAVLLFFVLVNYSSKLGGGALSGEAKNGHFFVSSPSGYTEVTHQQYQTIKTLEIATAVIWPIAMIALLYVERDRTKAFEMRLKLWTENLWQGKSARQKISKQKSRRRN
jgi:hypothetical protein